MHTKFSGYLFGFVSIFVSSLCLAGSIVINASQPDSALNYQDDSGTTKSLSVSWSDIQLVSKVNSYLQATYPGMQIPYMIDRASQIVSILVDKSAGSFVKVRFSDL